MARLAHIVSIRVISCVTLKLTGTSLQFHGGTYTTQHLRIAFGASGVYWARAFETFGSARRALLVDHIGEFVVWAIINTLSTLQEKTILALLALCD